MTPQALQARRRANSNPEGSPAGQPIGTAALLRNPRPRPRAASEGGLPPEVQEFRRAYNGQVGMRVLQSDMKVYRYFNGNGRNGGWFTTARYTTADRAKQELALPNRPIYVVEATIPAGTVVYEGVAAPIPGQAGGGRQFFVEKQYRPFITYNSNGDEIK